jgi:hypothetical protein
VVEGRTLLAQAGKDSLGGRHAAAPTRRDWISTGGPRARPAPGRPPRPNGKSRCGRQTRSGPCSNSVKPQTVKLAS